MALSDFAISDSSTSTSNQSNPPMTNKYRLYAEDVDKAVVEARRPLRQEIEKLIASQPKTHAPPFTPGEFIVMAIICGDTKYATKRSILQWIIEAFPYYVRIMPTLEQDWSSRPELSMPQVEDCLALIEPYFSRSFAAYEVPIFAGPEDDHWVVGLDSARFFLRRWLQPERKRDFPFFRLPPELRNKVLEMLLVMPEETVNVDQRTDNEGIVLKTIERDVPSRSAYAQRGSFDIGNSSGVLACSLVCRQMAREALSIFYTGNTFTFPQSSDMIRFIKHTPTGYLPQLKSIGIVIRVSPSSGWICDDDLELAMQVMGKIASPNHLTIKVDGMIKRYDMYTQPVEESAASKRLAKMPSMLAVARFAAGVKEVRVLPAAYPKGDKYTTAVIAGFVTGETTWVEEKEYRWED